MLEYNFKYTNKMKVFQTIDIIDLLFFISEDRPNLYGLQRLWGSVGWGLFSIIAGLMVDAFSNDNEDKDYISVFVLMVVIMSLDVLNSTQLKVMLKFQ